MFTADRIRLRARLKQECEQVKYAACLYVHMLCVDEEVFYVFICANENK